MSALLSPVTAVPAAEGLDVLVGVVADAHLSPRVQSALDHSGFELVAQAARAGMLVAACADRNPHVVVLAWDTAVPDGAAAMRVLAAALPQTRVVVVLREHSRAEIRAALRLGADGVVVADQIALALGVVVRAVALGQASIPRELRGELGDEVLSAREREVVALVADGLTNAAIAAHLCLSESTVKSHLSSAFSKLGVHSRAEAAALVRERFALQAPHEDRDAGPVARVVYGGAT